MGGPNAPLASNESVENIIGTLENLTFERTGCFLNHDGEEIPW
jgi:hypothetical protein